MQGWCVNQCCVTRTNRPRESVLKGLPQLMASEVAVQLPDPAASGQRDGQNTMQKHMWEVAFSYGKEHKRERGKKRLRYQETLQDPSPTI